MRIRGERKRWKQRERGRRKDERGAETTDKFGRMPTVTQKKEVEKARERGSITKITGEESEHSSEIQGEKGFQKPQKGCEEAEDRKGDNRNRFNSCAKRSSYQFRMPCGDKERTSGPSFFPQRPSLLSAQLPEPCPTNPKTGRM